MFGLGWTEVLVIATIAILVVPTKDLPALMRNVGRTVSKVRGMARDFQRQVEDAVRDDELDQLRKQVTELNRDTRTELQRGMTPYQRPASVSKEPPPTGPAMTPLPAPETPETAALPAPADDLPAAPAVEAAPAAAKS